MYVLAIDPAQNLWVCRKKFFLSSKNYFELSTLPRANRDEMRMQQNAFSNPMAAFRVVFGIPIGVKKRNVRGVAVWGGMECLILRFPTHIINCWGITPYYIGTCYSFSFVSLNFLVNCFCLDVGKFSHVPEGG